MSQLTDKKYIQTRARTLPIYKCLINKDWQESKLTRVIVMRKHTNGNITAGVYFVDLNCLGVKSTRYFFNVEEETLLGYFGEASLYEEIEYALAHNIIYAGHDFAMDFEIGPHKDFELTRFILEEDDDNIPLIEIEVGNKGLPHLIVMKASDRPDALAKLKKHAGPGNYYYSVAEEENLDEYFLDNIPQGEVDCLKVLNIETEDLEDDEKVRKREPMERIYLYAELYTRWLPDEYKAAEYEADQAWKKNWMAELIIIPTEQMQKYYDEYNDALGEVIEGRDEKLSFEDKMIAVVDKYAHNPVVAALFYEKSILMHKDRVTPIAKAHAEKLYAEFPMVKLSLALGALLQGTPDSRFDDVYNATSVSEIFPGEEIVYRVDFANFGLIKMMQCIAAGDVAFAVKFYNMIANNGGDRCVLLPKVWAQYCMMLRDIVDQEEGDEDEEENKE